MSDTIAGTVFVRNADGTVAYTGVLAASSKLQSVSLSDEFDVIDVVDGSSNAIIGSDGSKRVFRTTIEAIFVAATTALAKAVTKLPETPLAVVTIASSGVSFLDGSWNYMGGQYQGSVGNAHRFTMTLRSTTNPPTALAIAS